ncbi:FMRFamide receptor [Plakobranchus ocellatus]|uniref:FMRFamide receptor n=1 Tax=Plakobranchus ocellatus TaxID=259542 RepID=A0AAV4AAH8_9GAST|nr:FMRFamide receptor [Plakobranchus ocellatus]
MPITFFLFSTLILHQTQAANDVVYKRLAQFTLTRTITELLMYANHSVNFFLYCATGNKFRQQVLSLMRACCSQLNVARFRLGAARRNGRRRGLSKDGYDAEGSSGAGGANMERGRYGYSMSLRCTSATALPRNEGLEVTMINVAPRGLLQKRRSSCLSNDLNMTYIEENTTDNQIMNCSIGRNEVETVMPMKPFANSHQYSPEENSRKIELYQMFTSKGEDFAAHRKGKSWSGDFRFGSSNRDGRDTSIETRCSAKPEQSHDRCQVTSMSDLRNGGECSKDGHVAVMDCAVRVVNGHQKQSNKGSYSVPSCRQTGVSEKSSDMELFSKAYKKNGNCRFKSLHGVSLFSKRANPHKSKAGLSTGGRSSNIVRTEGRWSSWFRGSRNRTGSCGNLAAGPGRGGGGAKGACHSCKLHYYSSKRRGSNPTDCGSTNHKETSIDNEYVLLTPEMHWCDGGS